LSRVIFAVQGDLKINNKPVVSVKVSQYKKYEKSKQQIPNLKQIPMTQIQKSKQRIRLPFGATSSTPANRILICGTLYF